MIDDDTLDISTFPQISLIFMIRSRIDVSFVFNWDVWNHIDILVKVMKIIEYSSLHLLIIIYSIAFIL